MQGSNRLFDDVARLFTDAAGAAQGVRREAETMFKGQVERLIRDMDVATREEVDVLRDLVAALRSQNDALAARVSALEARLGAEAGSAGSTESVWAAAPTRRRLGKDSPLGENAESGFLCTGSIGG